MKAAAVMVLLLLTGCSGQAERAALEAPSPSPLTQSAAPAPSPKAIRTLSPSPSPTTSVSRCAPAPRSLLDAIGGYPRGNTELDLNEGVVADDGESRYVVAIFTTADSDGNHDPDLAVWNVDNGAIRSYDEVARQVSLWKPQETAGLGTGTTMLVAYCRDRMAARLLAENAGTAPPTP